MSSDQHFNAQDSQLIADMHRISQKSPRLIRSSLYPAPSDPNLMIRSWKMNEFKYYDVPSPFPTLARGLFTTELGKLAEGEEEGGEDQRQPRYRIVARGYDKFFNIGEVPWTDWASLGAHTGPNYTLSVKSNGCIIFIAAILPSKLIVTSKHALGDRDDVPESHAQAGHRWLKKHIASKGKTEEQLAAVLWEKNWTAVAELCDDEFEEHVLAYPPEKSGLYLHGINESRKDFYTLPAQAVDAFADEWGFLKTETIGFDTLDEVKRFTDEIGKTGKWKGEPLEGFVVRTNIVDSKSGALSGNKRPPYPTGCSFFFKVKFDEPYMMYREWREITKSLLSAKGSFDEARLPKSKTKRPETQAYLKWIKNEIKTNRGAFEDYLHGKGIIATRERFLKWLGSRQLTDFREELDSMATKEFGKTVILPIAIPGCGKTTVSVALAHLFQFGHTQSDDVQAKKPGPIFLKNVVNLLKKHDVVIADKNNHMRQHRAELREAVAKFDPPVRLLALNWALNQPQATLVRICGDRIVERGDRHQNLRANGASISHEDIVWRFIRQKEELTEDEVDACIDLDLCDSLEGMVQSAVDGCVRILGLKLRPSKKQIEEAVKVAKRYEPVGPGHDKKGKKGKVETKEPAQPRYFGILAELNLQSVIASQMEQLVARTNQTEVDGKQFWEALVRDKRVSHHPHITIVHRAGLPSNADLWERCAVLDRMRPSPLFSFVLRHLVWNDRVMALPVDDLGLGKPGRVDGETNDTADADSGRQRHEFVSHLPAEVRERLHITVGTLDASVLPYEARGLIEAWRRGDRGEIGSLELRGYPCGLRVEGRIRGLSY